MLSSLNHFDVAKGNLSTNKLAILLMKGREVVGLVRLRPRILLTPNKVLFWLTAIILLTS